MAGDVAEDSPRDFSVAYFMRCKPTKQKNQRVIERSSKARRRVIVYCCIQIFSLVKTVRSLTIKTTSAHFVFNILAPCCLPNEYTNDDQREQNEDVGPFCRWVKKITKNKKINQLDMDIRGGRTRPTARSDGGPKSRFPSAIGTRDATTVLWVRLVISSRLLHATP